MDDLRTVRLWKCSECDFVAVNDGNPNKAYGYATMHACKHGHKIAGSFDDHGNIINNGLGKHGILGFESRRGREHINIIKSNINLLHDFNDLINKNRGDTKWVDGVVSIVGEIENSGRLIFTAEEIATKMNVSTNFAHGCLGYLVFVGLLYVTKSGDTTYYNLRGNKNMEMISYQVDSKDSLVTNVKYDNDDPISINDLIPKAYQDKHEIDLVARDLILSYIDKQDSFTPQTVQIQTLLIMPKVNGVLSYLVGIGLLIMDRANNQLVINRGSEQYIQAKMRLDFNHLVRAIIDKKNENTVAACTDKLASILGVNEATIRNWRNGLLSTFDLSKRYMNVLLGHYDRNGNALIQSNYGRSVVIADNLASNITNNTLTDIVELFISRRKYIADKRQEIQEEINALQNQLTLLDEEENDGIGAIDKLLDIAITGVGVK